MINPNTKVVPIDHGWANMKTEQDVFTSGVSEITTEPALFNDVLEYNNKYYKIGGKRLEVKEDKVHDDNYYLLTLVSSHLKEQCQIMKNEIRDIKEHITSKAAEINMAFQKKGRDALFKIAEVTHLKPKLISLRNRVNGATEDVKDTIDRIY